MVSYHFSSYIHLSDYVLPIQALCQKLDQRFEEHQDFETFELAAENYIKTKSLGLVNIRRLPGDDLQYGPESEGIQDTISL